MRPTQPVISIGKVALLIFLISAVPTMLATGFPGDLFLQTEPPLDLTTQVPPNQQGYPGIPGQTWQGGGDPRVPDKSRYQLPLDVEIVGVSARDDGNFTLEVLLRNNGKTDLELPVSRNITSVEKIGNKSKRIFFLRVQALYSGQRQPVDFGGGAAAGSTSLPNSLLRLRPGEGLRVLLLVSADMVKRAFKESAESLEARVVCNEWQLEDDRYFIRASSDETLSKNVAKFVLRDGKPTALQP